MKNAPRISLKCKAFAVKNEYVKDVKHFFIRIITRDHCIDKNSITNRSKSMYIHVRTLARRLTLSQIFQYIYIQIYIIHSLSKFLSYSRSFTYSFPYLSHIFLYLYYKQNYLSHFKNRSIFSPFILRLKGLNYIFFLATERNDWSYRLIPSQTD